MTLIAEHRTQHEQLQVDLWLKELSYMNEEIEIMKHHFSDVYYRDEPGNVPELIGHFNETFAMQQQWLQRMKDELENWEPGENFDELPGSLLLKKSFRLQMQANRLINQELKDSFLKLFS